MKTIKKLQSEMDSVKSEIENYQKIDTPENIRRVKKCRTRFSHLKWCKQYIESNPTQAFLEKERDRLSNRINKFLENYIEPVMANKSEATKEKKAFEKDMGIPKIRKQLTAINFLLN